MITIIGNSHPLQEISIKSLSAYLNKHGIPVRLIYLNCCSIIFRDVIKQILALTNGSLLVGISMMSKDYAILLPLLRAIKKTQNLPIVLGGIHPSAVPHECLAVSDFVCVGEGEEPLRQLYNTIYEKKYNYDI